MQRKALPILEFDPAQKAVIEPTGVFSPLDVSPHCVICFFKDVVEEVAVTRNAKIVFQDRGVYGSNPFYQMEHNGRSIVFLNPIVGAPLAAAFLEEAIAIGCRKFIVCGGAGVLRKEISVGQYIVPKAAIRDEGTSYHYLDPEAGRLIEASPRAIATVVSTLEAHRLPYLLANSWTTDAIFRETPAKVRLRTQEGCVVVEMEAAALFAVAQFRGVELGYLLYGGDDVSGEDWDRRQDRPRLNLHHEVFWLSVEACLKL